MYENYILVMFLCMLIFVMFVSVAVYKSMKRRARSNRKSYVNLNHERMGAQFNNMYDLARPINIIDRLL